MRTLAHAVASLLVTAALLAPVAGCSDKTNCTKLNERMTSCSEPLWSALEPRLNSRMRDGDRARRNNAHFQYCKRIKGVYKQSGKINKCLKLKDCAKFAECFCSAVKKSSECGRPK